MHSATTQRERHGFTLLELVVALVASAVLLAGLGSVMLVARQIAYVPASSVERLLAAEAFDELTAELRYATYVTETSATAIEFVVTDRDGDGVSERIRYEWSGTAGDPLLKTVNDGTPSPLVDSVQQLQFTYVTHTETTSVSTTTESAEALLATNATTPSSRTRVIGTAAWSAQQIDPASFASTPPDDTLWWTPTRVEFHCSALAASHEHTLSTQVCSAGDPDDGPTNTMWTCVNTMEANLPVVATWLSLTFPSPGARLSLYQKYAIVWRGLDSDAGQLTSDDYGSSGVLESEDGGATWQLLAHQLYYRLYGTYTTPGPDIDVTRTRLGDVQVTLQTGSQAYSRLETSIPLVNRPEVLAAYWRADFDQDPTASDVNGDTTADWQATDTTASEVASPASYDAAALVGSVWYASGKLATQPANDFATTTIAEVSFRDTIAGGSGAVLQLNGDWTDGSCAPMVLRVQMETDGTQTLTLAVKSSDTSEVVLSEFAGLPSDFVRCRLIMLPNDSLVNLEINGENEGTYAYTTYAASGIDHTVSLYGDTSEAEFDYAEVRVLE